MESDWKLIRDAMNAAIDSCEALERTGYAEQHRGRTVMVNGQQVSVHDFLVSAWTLPESARYQVIRQRHEKGIDLPYVPETARILTSVTADGRILEDRASDRDALTLNNAAVIGNIERESAGCRS